MTFIPLPEFTPLARMDVPHKEGKITFLFPPFQETDYLSFRNKIKLEGLRMPTMEENVSLLYDVVVSDKDHDFAKRIRKMACFNNLIGSNGVLYVQDKGAYIQDHLEDHEYGIRMDESVLIEKLKSGDHSVRFVPFGYSLGAQAPKDVEKHPFITGLVGKEGAMKLAELVSKQGQELRVCSVDSISDAAISFQGLNFSGCSNKHKLYCGDIGPDFFSENSVCFGLVK